MSTEEAPVVVGVDGSETSIEALRWAVRYAALDHRPVVAVGVWHFPATYGITPMLGIDELEGGMRRVVEEAIEKALADGGDADVRAKICQGDASDVLVREARRAHLLVVGSRGLGAFVGTLLGSVSSYCAHHAPSPLLIFRPEHTS